MNIQIFGTKKSSDTRKAERFEYRMPEKVNPGNGFRDDLFLAGPFTVFFPGGKSFEAGRIFYDLQ